MPETVDLSVFLAALFKGIEDSGGAPQNELDLDPRELDDVCANSEITLIIDRPGRNAQEALRKIGLKVKPKKKTVLGLSCAEATRVFGLDPITRCWTSTRPGENDTKLFVIAGEGTMLLTMTEHEDGTISVVQESDLYPVR